MAVNKVEYINDSKTAGFAIAGDEKTINTSTAKTIEEDVKEGNTEELTKGQKKYLKYSINKSSEDNTQYETTPGDDTLPPDGEGEGENPEGNEQKTQQGGVGNSPSPASMMFGTLLLQSTMVMKEMMNPMTTLGVGIADTVAGAAAVVGASLFDSEYSNRLSEAQAAGEYIGTIEEYVQTIKEDIAAQAANLEDVTEYEDVEPEQPTEPEVSDTAEELQNLYAELEQAQEAGDQTKIDEITARIQELEGNQEEGPEETTGETQEEMIARIQATNSEAHDISDYTSSVSKFLKGGNDFGSAGMMNTLALTGAIATSIMMSVKASGIATAMAALPFGTGAAARAIAAVVLCATGSALFATASAQMAVKTAKEFSCGNKGKELEMSLQQLDEPLVEHDKIVESFAAQETESSEDSTESGTTEGEGGGTDSTTTSSSGTEGGNASGGSTSGGSSGGASTSGGSSSGTANA